MLLFSSLSTPIVRVKIIAWWKMNWCFPFLNENYSHIKPKSNKSIMHDGILLISMLPFMQQGTGNVVSLRQNAVAHKSQAYGVVNPVCAKFVIGDINIYLHVISQQWHATGIWNPLLYMTMTYLFCIVTIMAADDLVTQGAMTSATMLYLLCCGGLIQSSHTKG